MDAKVCDRCGKTYFTNRGLVANNVKNGETVYIDGVSFISRYDGVLHSDACIDFCDDCVSDFCEFLDNGKE